MCTYHEVPRDLPVFGKYDVVVAGGGTAGVFAGLAAARAGARTLILERTDCLGGMITSGMMSLIWSLNDIQKLVVKGIPIEFIEDLDERGGLVKNDIDTEAFIIYDTEMAKEVFEDMASKEPNLDVLYYTWVSDAIMEGNDLKGLIIENKSGRQAVFSKSVVDCTGDADVCAFAKAGFSNAKSSQAHPVTVLAKLGGVDYEKLKAYYQKNPEHLGHFSLDWRYTPFHTYRIDKELTEKPLPSHLEYIRNWFIIIHETIRPGEMMLNMTGETAVDGLNAMELTRAEFVSRKRIEECIEVFRMYMPGCENCYLITTASQIGVRESRQLDGVYTVTKEDLFRERPFEDTVCRGSTLIGSHTSDGTDSRFTALSAGRSFSMPYACMLPKKVQNLLVAGRCISATRDAMGATRPMSICMGLGQAAGVAAAMCAKTGVIPSALPVRDLQDKLLAQGVYLGLND